MMKTKLIILSILFFTLCTNSKATHFVGGEINWRCLSNGKFVFYTNVYIKCGNPNGTQGAFWDYSLNLHMDIYGASLPRDSNNLTFNNITLIPDLNRWTNNNNGDLFTECDSNGTNLSCTNLNYGTLQAFYYKSEPIQLKGTPPPSGWKFFLQSACCRELFENTNISTPGFPFVLRASMYSNLSNNSTDSCYDSSPIFIEHSSNLFCRGIEGAPLSFAEDEDKSDSLAFHLSFPIAPPYSNPVRIYYDSGYSYLNPTPDTAFNSNNIPLTLNSQTGDSKFKVVNGAGIMRYSVVQQVDSWRQGKKVSSVFREIPYTILDCPPISSGINNNPIVYINNTTSKSLVVNVVAGQSVFVPLAFTDNDVNNFVPQNLTFIPKGNQFAADFASSTNCALPPCAKIRNVAPTYNPTKFRYEITGTSSFGTQLRWQTDSNHLGINNTAKAYHFYYTVFDDHCPVPASVNGVIIVNVLPNAVGVEEAINKEIALKVFPNPNTGQFYIQSNESHSYTIRIRNLQGQLISQSQYENTNQIKLDLNENAGIYILEVENDKGERFQEKVIKL